MSGLIVFSESSVYDLIEKYEWGVHKQDIIDFCLEFVQEETEMWPIMIPQILASRHRLMFGVKEVLDVGS